MCANCETFCPFITKFARDNERMEHGSTSYVELLSDESLNRHLY